MTLSYSGMGCGVHSTAVGTDGSALHPCMAVIPGQCYSLHAGVSWLHVLERCGDGASC